MVFGQKYLDKISFILQKTVMESQIVWLLSRKSRKKKKKIYCCIDITFWDLTFGTFRCDFW